VGQTKPADVRLNVSTSPVSAVLRIRSVMADRLAEIPTSDALAGVNSTPADEGGEVNQLMERLIISCGRPCR